MSKLGIVKNYLQFLLALLSLISLLGVGWYLHLDVSTSIVTLFGIYVSGRSLVLGSYGLAASRDPTCNTAEVIEKTGEK